MKYLAGFTALFCVLILANGARPGANVHVQNVPVIKGVVPIGVNLGTWTSWGAEQLPASVLKNPGFEGTIDRTLVCIQHSGANWFIDDTDWNARPAAFWSGATFEILSGTKAGMAGTILSNEIRNGFGWFQTSETVTGIQSGDIVSITRTNDAALPAQWWFENNSRNRVQADSSTTRPGSGGIRSLLLAPDNSDPVGAISYLDAIGLRAGKLLPLNGVWRLLLWAKGTAGTAQLKVRLLRQGSPAFLYVTLQPSTAWQLFEWTIQPDDSAPPAMLELDLEATGAGGRIWLDDVSLTARNAGDSPFRAEVVETLRQLKPGYLRDWQGQLGDTWANRMASPEARRASRYRAGGDNQIDYPYSVPDFLQLCHDIGARPWLVLPTTLTEQEWRAAGQSLGSMLAQFGFDEIVVEFGNENWNQLFRPAGILSPQTLAEVSNRALANLRSGAGHDPRVRFLVSGNAQNPDFLNSFAGTADPSILSAVAPYYVYSYPAAATRAQMLRRLFLEGGPPRQMNLKQPGIYEMNASTLDGDAAIGDVNALLESPEAGAAMAWRAMNWLEAGSTRQCMYSFAGFDAFNVNRDLVHLYGITRNVATAGDFRSTGSALALINSAIGGDLYHVNVPASLPKVKAWGFLNHGRWSVVFVSASPAQATLTFDLPRAGGTVPASLRSPGGGVTKIQSSGQTISLQLAPYSVAVAQ